MTVKTASSLRSAGRKPRHLLHVFPSFAVGGAQIRFAQLANAHGDRYRHTVVSLDSSMEMAAAVAPSVDWVTFPLSNFDKRAGLRNIPKFRSILAEVKPDRLVTYNWGAIEWCLADRLRPLVPHIHIEDGFGPEERERQLFRRAFARRLALSGKHTQVIVPSRVLEGIAIGQWQLPPRNVIYVPNGVDCERFRPAGEERNRDLQQIVIGTVAGLRPEKRIDRLIEGFIALCAARPDRNLKLVIVGDGPDRAKLEFAARATAFAPRIVFTGLSETPELMLQEMDIFALSSDTEQMPLSVLEAMATALPVASLAVGDVFDMVSEANRPFIVPRTDPRAFENTLLALIDDPGLKQRLGCANREAALARFSHGAMVRRYAELFG